MDSDLVIQAQEGKRLFEIMNEVGTEGFNISATTRMSGAT